MGEEILVIIINYFSNECEIEKKKKIDEER